MLIDTDFPGGNVLVEERAEDRVRLRPDLRDTQGPWFYWAFRVRGADGRSVHFDFSEGLVGPQGPAYSTDEGETWQWLGAEHGDDRGFTYAFPTPAREVRFAVGIPYLPQDWQRFVQRFGGHPRLRLGELCTSRHGRSVPMATVPSQGEPTHTVLVTSRHHCCEAMATYALEGMVEALLEADPAAHPLAARADLIAVPFVDMDGVVEGDQGKNRRPRDHGRDYQGASLYPETAALRRGLPDWRGELPVIVLDLHCPGLRGAGHEEVHLVGSPVPEVWEAQQRFAAWLEAVNEGPLPYQARHSLPYGQWWNVDASYREGMTVCLWAAQTLGAPLTVSLEVPYASAGGVTVHPAGARRLGHALALALARYLDSAWPR